MTLGDVKSKLDGLRYSLNLSAEEIEALDIAIMHIDKAIPKKPVKKGKAYCCPGCGMEYVFNLFGVTEKSRCIECDQTVLWEEDK